MLYVLYYYFLLKLDSYGYDSNMKNQIRRQNLIHIEIHEHCYFLLLLLLLLIMVGEFWYIYFFFNLELNVRVHAFQKIK